jgi:hypothetical protein
MRYHSAGYTNMQRTPRIILFMDTSRGYEQGLTRGILKYSRLHGPWKFFRTMPVVSGGRILKLRFNPQISRPPIFIAKTSELPVPLELPLYSPDGADRTTRPP